MPAFNIKEVNKQGWLGKDMTPGYDYRESTKGKLSLNDKEDMTMTKTYPKGRGEPVNGFPDGKAYDHALIKTYPKGKIEGQV